MSARLAALAASTSQDLMTRWPLQEMLGADLLAAAARRIEADCGQPVTLDEVDGTLWLSVDSFALIQALAFLAGRLVAAFDRPDLRLRLARAGEPRPSRPDLVRPGRASRDLDGLADGRDADRRRALAAVGARRGGAARRRGLVRARPRARAVVLPLPAAVGDGRAGGFDGPRGQPARILRLRPVRRQRGQPGPRRPVARGNRLHGVRHRDHRTRPRAGRRDHPDRRDPHRQRQAAARRVLRSIGRSAAEHSRGGDPDPRHPAGDGPRPADDRRGAARLSCLRQRHGARGAQRGLRHALPEAQGGRERRAVRPAGARYPASVELWCIRTRHRTASRRSRRAWA